MAENRRTHPRKPVTFRVDYADAQGRTSMGLARNISIGGMYLEDAPQVSVGGTITVAFSLPTGQPCKVTADVVRVETRGYGLRFMHMSQQSWEDLQRYCAA